MSKKTVFGVIVLIILIAGGLYIYQNRATLTGAVDTMTVTTDDQGAAVITSPQALKVGISGPATAKIGQQVNFVASVKGGTEPYNYTWTFADGSTIQGRVASWNVAAPFGTQPVKLKVVDNKGVVSVATGQVTVTQ